MGKDRGSVKSDRQYNSFLENSKKVNDKGS